MPAWSDWVVPWRARGGQTRAVITGRAAQLHWLPSGARPALRSERRASTTRGWRPKARGAARPRVDRLAGTHHEPPGQRTSISMADDDDAVSVVAFPHRASGIMASLATSRGGSPTAQPETVRGATDRADHPRRLDRTPRYGSQASPKPSRDRRGHSSPRPCRAFVATSPDTSPRATRGAIPGPSGTSLAGHEHYTPASLRLRTGRHIRRTRDRGRVARHRQSFPVPRQAARFCRRAARDRPPRPRVPSATHRAARRVRSIGGGSERRLG